MPLFLSIEEFNSQQVERLSKLMGGQLIERQHYDDDENPEPEFNQCNIIFGNVPAHWLEQNPQLRWIQLESVGFGEYRSLDWSSLEQRIAMTNLAGFFSDQVAETVLAGILSHYRGIDQLVLLRQQQRWVGDPIREGLRCLRDAKIVLFGFGSINRRIAELLQPFGCKTTSFGRKWDPAALDTALQQSDIVISTVPETDLTVGVFNHKRLALLGASGVFVNAGRGSVVDEAALADVLQSGTLGGAVIDVTEDEPLPPMHPLWTTPNTILTQHSGGGSLDELDRKIDVFEKNLALFQNGQPLMNVVDFNRGY